MQTIADYHRSGLLLMAHCARPECGHAGQINPAGLLQHGLGDRAPEELRFRCSQCGGRRLTWTVHSREQARISRRGDVTMPGEWRDEWWGGPAHL